MGRVSLRAGIAILSTMVAICAMPVAAAALPGDGVAVEGPERHAAIVGGRVVDEHRHPVANASVRLFTEDGRFLQRTHTGDRGYFHFRRVRPGVYIIRAAKRGVGHGRIRFDTEGDRHRALIVLR